MYGVTVTVKGQDILVLCVPDMPIWEILERAAAIAKRQHADNEWHGEYQRKIAEMKCDLAR